MKTKTIKLEVPENMDGGNAYAMLSLGCNSMVRHNLEENETEKKAYIRELRTEWINRDQKYAHYFSEKADNTRQKE